MARQVLTIPDVPATLLQAATAAATYAPIGHTHAALYLPLTGGTLSGNLISNGTLKSQGATSALLLGDRTNGAVHGWSVYSDADMLRFRNEWTGSQLLTVSPDGTTTCVPAVGTTTALVAQGNVGVGVTPKAWGSGHRALQVGGAGAIFGNAASPGSGLTDNSYYDGSTFRALYGANAASSLTLVNGGFLFGTAPLVGAGAAQTFTTRLAVAPTGTLTLTPDGGVPAIVYGAAGQVWQSDYRSIQLGMGGALYAHIGYPQVGLAANLSYPVAGGTKYVANGFGATLLLGQDGVLYFDVAPNGTAGAVATTSQRMKVDGANLFWNHVSGPQLIVGAGAANTNVRLGSGAGNSRLEVYGTGLVPFTDGFMFLGEAAYRWTTVFATTPSINTSHASLKHGFARLDPGACVGAVLETDWLSFAYNDPTLPPREQTDDDEVWAVKEAGYRKVLEETAPARRQRGYVLGSDQYHTADLFGMADRYSASTHADLAVVACALQQALQRIAALEARPA